MTEQTEHTLMGEVIDFPTRSATVPTFEELAHHAADGAGDGHHGGPPPATTTPPDPDDNDDDGDAGRVRVDQPSEPERGAFAYALTSRTAQRRAVIPAWLRDRDELRDAVRWAIGHVFHVSAYHAVRVPKYAGRLTLRTPLGVFRTLADVHAWVVDAEQAPLRAEAVRRLDADTYMKLMRMRNDKVRWRAVVATFGTVATVAGAAALATAGTGLAQFVALAAAVAVFGRRGMPADKPLLDVAVVVPRVQKLTSEIVIRALASLGIAEINKAMTRGSSGITFPAPITRDGPGWRADVDLPYGVTVTDIVERRDRLASGLRRPMGCVWPEPAHDAHAGRLVLWVGDQDMNQVKPPVWPLLKGGHADVFKPLPFGTDQRGRPVTVTLMFGNALFGAMPRIGKTFAIKPLLLASGLDPLAETRVFELKGTGDLSFAEKFAHRYGSGPDDATIAACLASLKEVYKDLERRAKTISGLPKDVCPENKVTPQLAARKSLGLRPLGFFIDECQELFSHPTYGKEAGECATAIIKRGPAMGVYLVLATQRPDKDSLPTGVSANVGIRFCLRVMGQLENDMVLGTSAYRNGIRATTFTKNDRGIGYLVGEADDPQIVRTYYIDGPTADVIADRARALRKAAGTLSGYAAGDEAATTDATVSLVTDIVAVTGAEEDKIWSETVVARLAELRPELYGGWTPAMLSDALKPYGVKTEQVWGQDETGKGANRRGIIRDHVLTAVESVRT